MTTEILILLIAFQIKHYLADYQWQFPNMYENKGKPTGWFNPLLDHAMIHGLGTLLIVFPYLIYIEIPTQMGGTLAALFMFMLMMLDVITHFIIDRIKAIQKTNPSESWFWKLLGLDQAAHHLVGILIIYIMTI